MADLLTMQMNRLARNQKVIIWAHNFHIEKGRQFPNRDGTNHGPQTMGYFLDAAFGYQYAPFLLLGGRVEINWLSSFSPPRQFGLEVRLNHALKQGDTTELMFILGGRVISCQAGCRIYGVAPILTQGVSSFIKRREI